MIAASPKDFMTSNYYGGKLSAGAWRTFMA
jgi:hypothetical protein